MCNHNGGLFLLRGSAVPCNNKLNFKAGKLILAKTYRIVDLLQLVSWLVRSVARSLNRSLGRSLGLS